MRSLFVLGLLSGCARTAMFVEFTVLDGPNTPRSYEVSCSPEEVEVWSLSHSTHYSCENDEARIHMQHDDDGTGFITTRVIGVDWYSDYPQDYLYFPATPLTHVEEFEGTYYQYDQEAEERNTLGLLSGSIGWDFNSWPEAEESRDDG